ncbi:MAG: hypothetical protein QOJ39_2383 [Candidatus Eremiobacteraeota bacterium]|jgi:hypothetical protein|nr:hypothetical protein [Candidatus Eremiobacteraeota bacterium]
MATGVYNVLDYGADNTGASDSKTAIQNTVNAVVSGGGGIVFFPIGTYLVSDWVTFGGSNLIVEGQGSATIVKQAGTAWQQNGIFLANGKSRITIRDMQIWGNGYADATRMNSGLVAFLASSFISVHRVRFYNMQGPGVYCDGTGGVQMSDVTIDDCTFELSGSGRTTPLFIPAFFGSSGTGLGVRYLITNSRFINLSFHGVWLQASDSIVSNCLFENVGESRVVNAGPRNTISNNVDRDGYMAQQSGWFLESYPDDLVATGNRIYNAGKATNPFSASQGNAAGFFIAGNRTVVASNEIYNCYGGGIYFMGTTVAGENTGVGTSISGNTIAGSGYPDSTIGGISITSGGVSESQITLNGNTCYGNLPYDMRIATNIDPKSFAAGGNSAWPDAITATYPSLSGTTAYTLLESVPIAANAIWLNGSFRARMRGSLALMHSTATFTVLLGGSVRVFVYGTFVAGDTITYTVNGVNAVHTVTSAEVTAGLTAIAAGVASSINSAGTNAYVSGTAVATPVTYLGNQSGQVTITATSGGFAVAGTVTTSATATSSAGFAATTSTTLIVSLLSYTTPAAPQTSSYTFEVNAVNSGNDNSLVLDATAVLGTSIVSSATSAPGSPDTQMAQTLAHYGRLANASDSVTWNTMRYERF